MSFSFYVGFCPTTPVIGPSNSSESQSCWDVFQPSLLMAREAELGFRFFESAKHNTMRDRVRCACCGIFRK